MPHAGNVRGHFEPVREPDPRDLSKGGVRLLRRRRIYPDTDAPLLGTGVHGGRLRLLRHRLSALPHELTDGRHNTSLNGPDPSMGPKLSLYIRTSVLCQINRTTPTDRAGCSPGLGHGLVLVRAFPLDFRHRSLHD